ncbi:1,3-beta-glucan synthase component bgs3 [Symbiodinium microadriaticum]|uniref:1,3-beta-glucan synthase n=2 Tax=Symbiodinium TaxID=2949 RepID=A0A1Q9CRL9_SYMMI|nr:1,3-beta-glucan synthase component bgs3 [Symbiodinium microadriaticum]
MFVVGCGIEADGALMEHLKQCWSGDGRSEGRRRGTSLRTLPAGDFWRDQAATAFAKLQSAFGFQEDSVKCQFEHFLSLWRSHCAVVADRLKLPPNDGVGCRSLEEDLLKRGMDELHEDLLRGLRWWRATFQDQGVKLGVTPEGPDESPRYQGSMSISTSLQVEVKWCVPEPAERAQFTQYQAAKPTLAKLEEVATFLLVWGEAGNLRFMPEMLCFITQLALDAEPVHCEEHSGRSGAYLVKIVRPIYKVIFDEHYVKVGPENPTQRQKDEKVLKDGYATYLPPDCANYDDWNELFQDPKRLQAALPNLFNQPKHLRYEALKKVDWASALYSMNVKTHREIHSWWGVFAATHRLWFLHVLLYALSMWWVSSRSFHDPGSGWSTPLGGGSPLVCLSAIGLVVPLHLAFYWMSRWFTTGSALRPNYREGSTCQKIQTLLLQAFLQLRLVLLFVPVATFLWVRWLDAFGDDEWLKVHPFLSLNTALQVHVFVCSFGALLILLQPCASGAPFRPATPTPWSVKCLRWLIWLVILSVKFFAGLGGIAAIERATAELKISRLGREPIDQIPSFSFGPNWDKDIIEWVALWGTGLLCYVADTQFWFCLVCSVVGMLLAFHQRSWRVQQLLTEDALSAVPQRFAERVILEAPEGRRNRHRLAEGSVPAPRATANSQWFQKFFPDLWDRIIDIMRYEDKLDDFIIGQMKFTVAGEGRSVSWESVHRELHERQRFSPPPIFDVMNFGQRSLERDLGVLPTDTWPWSTEVQWRLNAFARNLASGDLPRPFVTPYIPGLTVLIPHYGEQILLCKKDLISDAAPRQGRRRSSQVEFGVSNSGEEVPLISWLEKRYHDDFLAFTSRTKGLDRSWPDAGSRWDQYTAPAHWEKLCGWASMRSQTLWRTVVGLMYYLPALECFHQMVKERNKDSAMAPVWDPTEVFTCMVSMQMYAFFEDVQYEHTEILLRKFPRSFQIAFIDHEGKGEAAVLDCIHPKQQRRYYSCLIDESCAMEAENPKRRKPRLKIELPGFPILGDGKGDNQNHAIVFSRGSIIQAIDANQGGYFEQMLLLPCALGEFRRRDRKMGGLEPRIVGFAEHITSDIGSLGDFAAGAETAFGTVLQRSYALLGARMHYGHPDMMNKEVMIQQGGISKATKTVNLSEDIFAGMDLTLRGNGRNIVHREYLHVAKGRDLGFNTILTFFSKLSAGTGEQMLTRQMARLGNELDLPEFLTFFYAHAGYYLTQFFLSKSIPLLVFIWLLVVLDDPEQNFPAMSADDKSETGAKIVARMLITQYSWLLMLFIVAQTAPLAMQVWLESSSVAAILRILKQMVTLAPLHFIFQAKIIGTYLTNEVTLGGAKYLPTGRGLPTERRAFLRRVDGDKKKGGGGGLYNDYATLALYDGAQLLIASVMVLCAGGLAVEQSLVWWLVALGLTICSWLLAPFVFNPYQFAYTHFRSDLKDWRDFFFQDGGKHWAFWYAENPKKADTRLRIGAGLRTSSMEVLKRALFLGCWYTILNQKVHMLTVIFEGTFRSAFSIALVVMPPVGMSIVICAVLPQVSQLCGCDDRELHYGWSALLVVLADLVETFCYLWKLLSLRWWKSFTIGILLKFSLLSLCLELVECAFRLKGSGAPLALRRRAKLWLYGHRMAQDLAVSSLIFGLLSIGTFFDCIKAKVCGCKGCGLHNILVYRDPGGVHKRQVIRRAQNAGEFTEAGGEEPPALAPLELASDALLDAAPGNLKPGIMRAAAVLLALFVPWAASQGTCQAPRAGPLGPMQDASACANILQCGDCVVHCNCGGAPSCLGSNTTLRCLGENDAVRNLPPASLPNGQFPFGVCDSSADAGIVGLVAPDHCGLNLCCPENPFVPAGCQNELDARLGLTGQCQAMVDSGSFSCEQSFCPTCGKLAGQCDHLCGYGLCSVCGDCFRSARLAAGQPEPCDDGNAEDGDGCSSSCLVEDGWTCTKEAVLLPDAALGGVQRQTTVDRCTTCTDSPVAWTDSQGYTCEDYEMFAACDSDSLSSDALVLGGRLRMTPEYFQYQFLYNTDISPGKPLKMLVSVAAANDAHIFLGKPGEYGFEIVVGGWNNGQSVLRTQPTLQTLGNYYGALLDPSEMQTFWVYYAWDGNLSVGRGEVFWEMGFLQGSYLTANLVSTRNWYDSVSMASLLNEVHISTGWGAVGSWDVRLVDGFAGMRIGDLAASGVDATSACCACGGGVSGRPCEQRVNGQLPFQARGDVAGSTEGSRRLSGLGGFASDPLLLGKPGTDGFSLSLNFTSCAVTQESDPSGDWCTLEAVVAPGMAKSRVITPLASVWTQILDPGCRIMGHHQVGSSYMWQATGCNMTAGGLYVVALHLTTSQGDVLLLMDLQIPGKPTYTPSSVVFSDSDVRRGYLLGEVTIEGAEDESNILQYRAYYGRSNDTRVNFLSDERAAGIGWVNTYADGGLRNGYNNECLYGDCSWKMELSKTAGNGRPYNQYLIRHEHTGKCLCYANAVLSQTECYANLLTVDSPTAYKYLPSGNGALIDRNNELYKTVWYRDIGDRATKTLESVLAIMQQVCDDFGPCVGVLIAETTFDGIILLDRTYGTEEYPDRAQEAPFFAAPLRIA